MRKSKLLLMILTLVVALALVVACGNDDDNGNGNGNEVVNGGDVDPGPVDPGPADPEPDPEPEPDPGPAPIPRPAGLVYSLATDAFVQHQSVGTTGVDNVVGGSDYLEQAGNPMWMVVESPFGGNGIRVLERNEPWEGPDIQFNNMDLDLANNSYRLVARGRLAGGGTVTISGSDSPWSAFASVDVDDDFVISQVVDADLLEAAGERGWLRIQSAGAFGDLFIYSIEVTLYIPTDDDVVYQLSADPFVQAADATTQWRVNAFPAPYLTNAGDSATFRIAAGPYGNGIAVVGRYESWHAVDLQIADMGLDMSYSYTLTLRGNIPAGGTGQINGADSPWSGLAAAETDDDGNFEVSIVVDAAMVEAAGERGWFRLTTGCTNDYTITDIILRRQ